MATRQLVFPDSITEWIIQAIGITADKGLCIADPFKVTAFRSFFIQLDLPYKATRLEHFDVKATIFSYGLPMDPSKTANIYLEGAKNLCYSSETGNPSNKIQIELPPNSARTVSFPMIPLKKGKFRIKVTAIVIDSAIPELDVIEKFLYVVNEGIEEQLTIQVCLDPNKQMEDCKNDPRVFKDVDSVNGQDAERIYSVDLTLPKDSIPGTGSAVAYTESDTMTNVIKTLIENVDSLFRQPAGSGEQTMIRLAPTVYAMMYVKETRQITEAIEIKGNEWIRDGVTREVLQFRHPDGSYAAWQDRQSSTWLTAFVSKVLCHAKRVVDDAVDEKDDIIISIDWLKNQVTDDGQFIDHKPVIHRDMIGQIDERDPSLTAFVLIVLLECDIRTEGLDQTIRKSTKFLENLDKNLLEKNPYILALSTYALAMAKSAKRWEFKALLHKLENRKGKDTYWGNAGGSPASAHSVETTAYALLAMSELSDWRTSAKIVRWLTSQRDAKGSFRTTQDTVVGLQSLSTYSIKTYSPNVNLKVQLLAKQWEAEELELNRENAFVQRIVRDLPVEHNDNVLTVKVSGSGKGIMNIDLRYNRPARDEEDCPFEISYIELNPVNDLPVDPQLAEESKCDVCGYCEEEKDNHGYNFEFSDTQEADPKMVAKREAGRHVRATQTKICIRFSVSSKTEKKFGMSIVNFGLETDVSVVKEDLDKLDFCRLLCVFDTTCPPINYKGLVEKPLKTGKLLADNQNIAGYEMPNSEKDFIVFYLQEVTSDKTKFIFRLKDSFEGDINSRQPSSVKVYDYYNPDMSCTQLYGTGPNKDEGVGYECDKEQKQCQCLQNKCALPVEDDIQTLAKMKKYPALKLYQYTCNPEKANYAVVVEIESVGYDPITEQKTAIARVLKSIHQGIEQLSKDDNMDFFWSLYCAQPNLEEGGIYYIIGKDGNLFRTDEGTNGYYFVILPNVIRYNHSETVTVSVFELENAHVKIWLEHGKKLFSNQTVVVRNEEKPVYTTVKVTENDLFDYGVKYKPRKIDVCCEYHGTIKCTKVILSFQTGYLIVQTDKPIYTPLNKVTVRTLALDESLRAVDGWQVGMDIISPKGITVARKTVYKSESGFFQNEFTLPPYPDIGIWTARSFYRGQFETESRALFEVQEYVLPTFDVTINVDVPYILSDTAEIKITVRAMYVYRKPVEGNALLTLFIKNESGDTEYLFDVNRKELYYDGKSNTGSEKEFIINVDDIMNSTYLSGKAFPDNSRLHIVAKVYEDATGKEEAASHDGTMFVVDPYKFIFSRSKSIFKPGWEYHLKVDMLYANEQPATGEDIEVRMYKRGKLHTNINATTDDQGKVSLLFQTVADDKTLTFKAVTRDNLHASEEFDVNGYADDHQIVAEHLIKDNTMTLRAYANMKASESTGFLFMVVTRGKVVLTKFKETSNVASVVLSEEIQELISPSARLLVFYVDKKTGTLVADSDKFHVVQKCRDKGLKLETLNSQVQPGAIDLLTVEGDPKMWVGLSVMDKALLILNNKNVLRKSKMFQALESHDLGCGAGSGRNAADVFKQTGLTVLTNAYRPEGDLQRTSVGCEGSKRRKRDTGECYYAANIRCCEKGYEFAKNILHEAESPEQLDPYTKCYAKARTLVKEIPMRCVMAFLTSCRTELEILISDKTGIVSKSFADESDYYDYDIARLADAGFKFRTRSNFRESWLFEVKQLDSSGQFQTNLNYPHSITEWMIQAIGITSSKGLCIADPVNVTAFRDFFVQLDLPYKATRLEQFDVKATIFSYGQPTSPNRTANIYLEGVQHLCYNSVPGTPSPRIQISLPPNSAHTVRFPVIPLKKGMFSVKVSAFVMDLGIPIADVVEKQLYVENEGIEENLSIQVCLDPSNQMEDCKNDASVSSYDPDQRIEPERMYSVDLTLPQNSIPGTGSATAYIQSNLMDNVVRIVIEGVDDLLRAPTGCGEQTLSKFAPTVYAMMYLKETYQVTKEIEILGSRHIREGIAKEMSTFMKFDGSFVFYKSSKSISDTWGCHDCKAIEISSCPAGKILDSKSNANLLEQSYTPKCMIESAIYSNGKPLYNRKVFCQARRIVDNAGIVRQDIASSINWLKTKIKNNGQFINDNPYKSYNAGRVKSEDPLTAFVLITLLECDIRDKALNESISKAMHFLENLEKSVLKKNPHLLAISTYALAMANSKKKWEFKDLLHQIEKKNGNDSYWGTPGSNVANAHCVETTAYALLAMMEFDDWKISTNNIVRWLTSQRNSNGAFRSTQDTVVALQALSTYNVKSYSPDVDLVVEVLGWEKDQLKITPEKKGVQQIAKKLPVENKGNRLNVLVTGTGTARMIIDLRYNRPATEEEDCPFEISPIDVDSVKSFPIDMNLAKESICDVCGYCEKEPAHSDYDIFDPPEENLEMENNFRRRKRGAAVSVKDICIKFSVRSKTEKEFGMSIVNFGLETGVEVVKDDLDKLLDETENIERYEMPSNGKGFVIFYLQEITSEETKFIFRLKDGFEGDTRSRHPSSVKVYDYYNPGICAQPVEEKLLRLYNERKYPVLKLYRYTCNPEKADYAMLVHIESTDTDEKKRQRTAVGRVLESLHQGIEQLEVDDEVDFFWSEICDELNIEKDGEYFIIGKDGNIFKTDEGKRYKYPLMGTTLVIKTGQEKPLSVIMDRYQKLLKKRNGCSS